MATCAPKTIGDVSADLMHAIIAELNLQDSISVSGNNPRQMVIESPVRIELSGRHASNELVIEATSRPRLVTCNRIYDQITELIDNLRESSIA